MTSPNARSSFASALRDLQKELRRVLDDSSAPPEFHLVDPNALSLQLAEGEVTADGEEPGTYYFDLTSSNGKVVLRDGFLFAWDKVFEALNVDDPEERRTAFFLFILHELVHVPQNLDSPTHDGVRHHQPILRTVDYHADAFAILLCFHLLRERSGIDWRPLLAKIIGANLIAIAVFEFYAIHRKDRTTEASAAPTRYPFDVMLASRLLRHLTWHYQYHRALSMRDGSSFEDFDIKREPVLSIEHLMFDSAGNKGITAAWPSTRLDPEFWLADRGRVGLPIVYRHRASKPREKWEALFKGIFEVDVRLSYMFFNEFLSRTPEVVTWKSSVAAGDVAADAKLHAARTVVQTAKYIVDARKSRNLAIGDRATVTKTDKD